MPDARSDELHMWVGYSITAWAEVEDGLFELCWRSLGSTKERAAIVYFKTPGTDSRLTLVDELVKTVLPKQEREDGGHHHTDLKAWIKLRDRIKTQLATRRRIAHHPAGYRKVIVEFKASSDDLGLKESTADTVHLTADHEIGEFYRPEIYESEAEKLRGRSGDVDPLFIGAVRSYSQTVSNLAAELQNFVKNAFGKYIG